ncbi:MAG: hypothetical protein L6M37_01870 [Candidatus Methylarchaceae archaeon HK02M1]|nr:hypothetical protein [Candidatus Methylarchaceae archaeon HK02M1]
MEKQEILQLRNSGTRIGRERYNRIQKEFRNLTYLEFDVALRTKEVRYFGELSCYLSYAKI